MSKISKVKTALISGSELTAKQIRGSYGLKNPHDAIYQLRNQGVCIYSNATTLTDGTRTTKYRVGTPSKRMVALTRIVGGSAFFKG
jgi:hypothetical protein